MRFVGFDFENRKSENGDVDHTQFGSSEEHNVYYACSQNERMKKMASQKIHNPLYKEIREMIITKLH